MTTICSGPEVGSHNFIEIKQNLDSRILGDFS